MAAKYNLQNIDRLQGRAVFLDANVLIYLFWPTGSNWENKYASVLARLHRQQNEMCVDFLVISEFINRAIRIEHAKLLTTLTYKQFRDTQEGRDALKDIYKVVETVILGQFHFVGKTFSKVDVYQFFNVDHLDFVDKAILAICKENNCVLLTNDKDFKYSDIDILTAHPAIINN
jgi:predicted nucleic acid-binding protein